MKSQPNQALNQANAKTDKGHDHEHQQQGLRRNASAERRNPRNSLSDERGHISQNLSHCHRGTPLQADEAPNKANAQTHERHNDEHENQGVRSDGTDKGANPLNSLSDEGRNVGKNSSDSNGSLSLKTYHLSKKITKSPLSNARYIPDNTNDNNQKAEANKVAERLRHEESGKMFQKPKNKGLHISHEASPLPA